MLRFSRVICRLRSEVNMQPGMEPLWDCSMREKGSPSTNRNHQSLGTWLVTQGQSVCLVFRHRSGCRCHVTSWSPRGVNLAKHARLQLVIDRWSLSSDLKFWYVFQIETSWQVRILARYRAIEERRNFNCIACVTSWKSDFPISPPDTTFQVVIDKIKF